MLSDKQVLYHVQLLEHLPAAVISTNAHFTILSWNHEAEKLYGWEAKEVIGKYAPDFIQPLDKEIYSEAAIQSLTGKGFWNGYVQQPGKGGSRILVETSVKILYNASGDFEGTITVNKDVSGQKQLEDKLLLYEGRLKAATSHSLITISNQDTQLKYTYLHNANQEFREDEAIGKTDEEALPEAFSRQVIPIKKRVLRTGKGEQHEISFGHPTGNYSYLITIEPMFNQQQETIGLTTAAINISSFKNIESSLYERESQLAHITNALPVLISYVDAQERYIYVNQNYETWFGIPRNYMLGKTLHEIAGDELYEKHKPYFHRALAGEKVEFDELTRRQGEKCYLHIYLLPFIDKGIVRGFYVLAQDQTELLTAKQELERSNQLYQAITMNFPKGNILLLDNEYNITFAEGRGMRERGIHSEVFVGKHVSAFFDNEAQWNKHYSHFVKVLSGETVTFTDFVLDQHYEFTGTPLPDKDGRINRIMCIVRNITDQFKLEQKLKQHAGNLQEAQKLAKLGFWEYYPQKQQLVWSDMMYEIFDRNIDEGIPGIQFFKEIISPSDWEVLVIQAKNVHKQQTGFRHTLTLQFASGRRKYIKLYAQPLEQPGMQPTRLFGATMDITDQYMLEEKIKEQDARMQSLFESDTVGIIFWEVDGRITHANDYFLRLIGYSRQELEAGSINWVKLTPLEWADKDHKAMESLLTDSTNITKEKEYFHKNGTRIPVMMGSAFLAGYKNKGASFVLDTTELRAIRTELEKKAQELKYSNSELEKFAYVAAHDLQEPLNTLSGLINLLHYQADASVDEEIKKLLNFIPGIINRMQQLIKNLLEYSRIGSAQLQISRFCMDEVVKVVQDSLAKRIEDTGSTIVHTNLPTIYADMPQMTQLIQNLVGNAIKFRDAKPMHIEIAGEDAPGGWLFSVKDTGIGMDMANAGKIFGAFQRLHTRKEFEGTGLGLTICQKIVERHGGKIWVESEPGVGSHFYFTIQKKEEGHIDF
jgi:PAS domain S-box-containing protein